MFNKSALRKTIFLLMCTALMVTCIGCAAALDSDSQDPSYSTSAYQIQSGSVTNDAISLSAYQSAQSSTTGVGGVEISQVQDLNSKILTYQAGEVKSVTGTISQDQTVDTVGGDSSATKINQNYVYTGSTDTSPNFTFGQVLEGESAGDISQQQKTFVKIVDQNDKYHYIIHMKQKQS